MKEIKRSKLETLTMKDNFMFGAVMCEPENCRPFLEMALGFPIGKLDVSIEKSLVYHPEYKGVRFDVEAGDANHTRYNVEMQVIQKPYLERRARYYHSQIDMDLLRRGGGYGSLSDAYVIFICDFDPFGYKKYRYTFQNICLEEKGFVLKDGQTTMFLSTRGENSEEVPGSLVSFLKIHRIRFIGEYEGIRGRLCAAVAGCGAQGEGEPGDGGEVYAVGGDAAGRAGSRSRGR